MRCQHFLGLTIAVNLAASAAGQVQFLDEAFDFDRDHPAAGAWIGNITADTGDVLFGAMHAARGDGDSWSVAMTCLEMGALAAKGTDVAAAGSSFAFTLPSLGKKFHFDGAISEDGQRFSGKVIELGQDEGEPKEGAFEFARTPRAEDLPEQLAFTGELSVQGFGMGMSIVLAQTPGGNWVGHLDVPMQQLHGFPLVNFKEEDGTITARLPVPGGGAEIEVRIDERKGKLTGTFRQMGMEIPIAFDRNKDYAYRELPRPQHPMPPYPYEEREITVEHPDGFTLAGTLTIPEKERFGAGPFAVAVLISGGGQQDRDESVLGHKPFLVIADYLTRRGIAVMRYDDRGAGGSGGLDTLENATSEDFATDTRAIVDHLKTIDVIDSGRIGLVGHSEGGIIGPMVARNHEDIAFIVMMAGPGVIGRDLYLKQVKLGWSVLGAADEDVERWGVDFARVIAMSIDGADADEIMPLMEKIGDDQAAAGFASSDADQRRAVIEAQLKVFVNPWMRFFLAYDPAPALRELKCPVLAVNGTLDLQVWHEQNLDAIQRIMTEAGGDITIKRYERLNHLFQPTSTGAASEYAKIEITFDEQVMADIADWIIARTAGTP